MTLAILDTLEETVLGPLGYEPFRIGSSGGTMASLARTLTPPGQDSTWWLERASEVSSAGKIGGSRTMTNLYNLGMYGGLLRSDKLTDLMEYVMEGDHVNGRTAACTFSITCRYEPRVVLDQQTMTPRQIAEWVTASISLPLAGSPTEILNRSMPLWLQKKWNVEDHPDEYSACSDGGIGSYMPVSLRGLHWSVPVGTPVIGVALDSIGVSEYQSKGLVGPTTAGGNPFSKVSRSCWSVTAANATEDWEKAVADSNIYPAYLFQMLTPKHLEKYELRLDTTLEEAMEMYEYGVMETTRLLRLPMPGTNGKTLAEALAALE